jgi:ABC-2 type transport system ATP-binding protein
MRRVERLAVEAIGVSKRYGDRGALQDVSVFVPQGRLHGLLGPNGAGKTTIVEILEGHRSRTGGDVDVLGFDPELRARELRERIGIVPQEGGLEPVLTVREVIGLYSAAYPHPRPVDEVIELVGLEDKAGARVETLSGGQKRRLDLAVGIAGDPELVFLDEPTTGFDPSARRRAWELVDRLRSLRKTIVLTTHYMEEAQRLADRVAVIASGRIVAEGDPSTLAGREHGLAVVTFRRPDDVDVSDLPIPRDVDLEQVDGRLTFRTQAPTRALRDLVIWASDRGRELDGLTVTRPSLEDVYLELTDERRREAA